MKIETPGSSVGACFSRDAVSRTSTEGVGHECLASEEPIKAEGFDVELGHKP
ncbi:hypothetical protein [Dokdonella sp.]|uniref:hypothetical protein n=1 Tax=Dokdonella sp. TaxID=2291710 RepID=UPI0035289ADE